jgi:endoglucanase
MYRTFRCFHCVCKMAGIAILTGICAAVVQAAPSIVEVRTAAPDVIVVVIQTDMTYQVDHDDVPVSPVNPDSLNLTPSQWQVIGMSQSAPPARYSIPWDEPPKTAWNHPTNPNSWPVITRHRIYLSLDSPLQNSTTYTINTPYGNTNWLFNSTTTFCESIKVNQVGYSTKGTSRFANFGLYMGTGGSRTYGSLTYQVIHESTGLVVTNGPAVYMENDTDFDIENPSAHSGEHVYRMSLNGVPAGGPYYVSVVGAGRSRSFGVGDFYSEILARVTMRGMYLHRCGMALTHQYTPFAHAICHTSVYDVRSDKPEDKVIVDTNTPLIPMAGGYHDAGDMDHTFLHPMISILMLSFFDAFPNRFIDNQYNIPESGNGIPDFLDEIMWGLKIWENLQVPEPDPRGLGQHGGVRAGWSTWGFTGYGDHNAANDPLVYGTFLVTEDSTAMVAGIFAQASRLIRPYNAAKADELLNRAQRAWDYLVRTGVNINEARTRFMYPALQRYLATGDPNYHTIFHSAVTRIMNDQGECDPCNDCDHANCPCGPWTCRFELYHPGRNDVTCHTAHFISYLLTNHGQSVDAALVQTLKNRVLQYADTQPYMGPPPETEPYPQGVTRYMNFGAGTAQGRYAELWIYATLCTTDSVKLPKYTNAVSQYADFPLGLNPMNMSYYTGLGTDQPISPLDCNSYFTKYGTNDRVTLNANGTALDNFLSNNIPIGNVPGICVYGPTDGRSEAKHQLAVSQKLWPSWTNLPPQRHYAHGWSLINGNEFTVRETMTWNLLMYSFLYTPVTGPPAPSNLNAILVSCTQINLNWTDPANNETGFTIERKVGAGGTWATLQTVGANINSYPNTGLAAGQTYFYRVRANYASGNSAWSNEASATTAAPQAPSGLSATSVSLSQINLSWTETANNETGFKIERKTGAGGTYSQITTVGPNVTTYPNTGLAGNTTYYYRVRAYNGCGDSLYSNEAFATTTTPPPTNITALRPSVTMTIDGNLAESSWSINNAVTKPLFGSPNNTVTFGVLWDCTYLYVGTRVLDGSLFNDSTETWHDDSIEIYIDGNHNKGTSYDAFDRQIVKGYSDGTIWVNGSQTAGILHAWAAISGGYSVEVAIPWSNLGISPNGGTIIGLDVGSNDDDNGSLRESQVMWSGTVNNWTDTSPWGNVTLSGSNCEELTPDANTIALYHFNSDYNDYSGRGYHLTTFGNVTRFNNPGWMQNPSGQAARFSDVEDQLIFSAVPDSLVMPGPGQTPLSIEARIYVRAYKSYDRTNSPIIELHQDWNAELKLYDNKYPVQGEPIGPTVNGSLSTVIVNATQWQNAVPLNAWRKFKLTFAADGTARCYINDTQIGTAMTSIDAARNSPPTWTITLGNFDGDIDEVRISNIVR